MRIYAITLLILTEAGALPAPRVMSMSIVSCLCMRMTPRHSAWLVLALFVVGGWLAPSAHTLQHAWQEAQERKAAAEHCRDHAHDGPGVETPLPAYERLVCPPYHLVFGISAQPHDVARSYRVAPVVTGATAQVIPEAPRRFLVRGPPHVA